MFKDGYVFSKADIIGRINYVKNYPLIQINSALSRLVNDNSEIVYDYYNNTGKIINIGSNSEISIAETVKLIKELIESNQYSENELLKNNDSKFKNKFLNIIEDLKNITGVYYIYNKDGIIIYIGKYFHFNDWEYLYFSNNRCSYLFHILFY